MNRIYITIIVFLTLASRVFSQTENELTYTYRNLNVKTLNIDISKYKNNMPENICLNIPEEVSKGIKTAPVHYIDKLVQYLTDWTKDDYLKVKSIHDWICLNIDYDMIGYNKGEIKLTDPYVTLRYQNAVCGGYASLFNFMVKKTGIETTIISGFTKGKSKYAIGDLKIFTRHAWNSVKINEYYYLVDVTWDSGFVMNNKYYRKYSTNFFFCDPFIFVKSHYPVSPGWLLLDNYISLEEFKKM